MVKIFRPSKLTNTQLLIIALTVSLIFLVVLISLFTSTAPGNEADKPLLIPPPATEQIAEQIATNTAITNIPSPLSITPESQFRDVSREPNYDGGGHAPTAAELVANQSQILGATDFDALGSELALTLTDGILTYINLNTPQFVYRPIIIKNSLYYDPNTDHGGFSLIIANQQGSADPDLRYNVTFTAEPPAMNFAKQ